jgi:hypothetical protein
MDIRNELDGLDWHWELGSKHWKLMVDGRLVAILPRGSAAKQTSDGRPLINVRAQIRRFRRQQAA